MPTVIKKPANYADLSFEEKIQFAIDFCNVRIDHWDKFQSLAVKKEANAYITIIELIRDYLHGCLKNDFFAILEDGVKKYDDLSSENYMPTIQFCKIDSLNENDLSAAMDIVNQSAFLSTKDFIDYCHKRISKSAVSESMYMNNSHDKIVDFVADMNSNGFKYFLQGNILDIEDKWKKEVNQSQVSENIHNALFYIPLTTTGLSVAYLIAERSLPVLAFAAFSFAGTVLAAKMGGAMSDKIALTFFGHPDQTSKVGSDVNVANSHTPKQHVAPGFAG